MKTIIQLSELPPSVNHIYRRTKTGMTKTAKYRAWAKGAGWDAKCTIHGITKWDCPVFITVAMRRPRANSDLDNRLKGIGDLLQDAGIILNDKQIHGWNVWWTTTLALPDGVAAEISITAADP